LESLTYTLASQILAENTNALRGGALPEGPPRRAFTVSAQIAAVTVPSPVGRWVAGRLTRRAGRWAAGRPAACPGEPEAFLARPAVHPEERSPAARPAESRPAGRPAARNRGTPAASAHRSGRPCSPRTHSSCPAGARAVSPCTFDRSGRAISPAAAHSAP